MALSTKYIYNMEITSTNNLHVQGRGEGSSSEKLSAPSPQPPNNLGPKQDLAAARLM